MAELNQVYKCLESLTMFLQPALPFLNSHLVDYFTKSHWENHLPEKLKKDMENKTVADMKDYIQNLVDGKGHFEFNHSSVIDISNTTSLDALMLRVGQLLLTNMKMSIPLEELEIKGTKSKNDFVCDETISMQWKFEPFMSEKKMHEVEAMSDFVSKVAKVQSMLSMKKYSENNISNADVECNYLVDIGSGKGYLSSFLSFLHHFNVLAIDSSSVNSEGCAKRSAKLKKNWTQLIRREFERKTLGESSKRGKHWKSCKASNKKTELVRTTNIDAYTDSDKNQYSACPGSQLDDESKIDCKDNGNADAENNERLKNLTMFVTEDTDLVQILRDNFKTSATSFGLIGLHTCGNLGADSLRLFVSNENAKFVCNVPCCYHLLDESVSYYDLSSSVESKKPGLFSNPDIEANSNNIGFPLSQYFLAEKGGSVAKEFYLGRNARMLSSYSLHRLSRDEQNLTLAQPLLYRVLLQVIIKEKLGHTLLEHHVGRIGEKSSNFQDYVRKSLDKLHISHLVQISDEEIENVYITYEPMKERFNMYFLLRSIFAPLIEGCILLDRLAYLLEQDTVKEAFIVELFNPFLSPRCNAILALK